jgi:hypothetical protein
MVSYSDLAVGEEEGEAVEPRPMEPTEEGEVYSEEEEVAAGRLPVRLGMEGTALME